MNNKNALKFNTNAFFLKISLILFNCSIKPLYHLRGPRLSSIKVIPCINFYLKNTKFMYFLRNSPLNVNDGIFSLS